MRNLMCGLVVALVLAGFTIGHASDRDETIVTVQITSAEHEAQEGYFALGDSATIMVKPGSDLHRFLSRQRDRKVKITLVREDSRELSRLSR